MMQMQMSHDCKRWGPLFSPLESWPAIYMDSPQNDEAYVCVRRGEVPIHVSEVSQAIEKMRWSWGKRAAHGTQGLFHERVMLALCNKEELGEGDVAAHLGHLDQRKYDFNEDERRRRNRVRAVVRGCMGPQMRLREMARSAGKQPEMRLRAKVLFNIQLLRYCNPEWAYLVTNDPVSLEVWADAIEQESCLLPEVFESIPLMTEREVHSG